MVLFQRPCSLDEDIRRYSYFVQTNSMVYLRLEPLHFVGVMVFNATAIPNDTEVDAGCMQLTNVDNIILRVRPETLCRITEFSEHESNGRELDEGERVAVEVLPVLGQSAAAVEPGDGAFDHPTPGLDDEALHPIG